MALPKKMKMILFSDEDYAYSYPKYATSIDYRLELTRNSMLNNLLQTFVDVFVTNKIYNDNRTDKICELYVNWLQERISEREIGNDPVIPMYPLPQGHDDIIREAIEESNIKRNIQRNTNDIITQLKLDQWCQRTNNRLDQWKKMNKSQSFHSKIIRYEDKKDTVLKIESEEVRLNHHMYERMRYLFMANASVSGTLLNNDINKIIDYHIYIVMLRHQGVSPSKIREGGWVKKFFEDLTFGLNSEFELFASSLNSFSKSFCSLFPDVELHFGSKGNLYDMELTRGFYHSNPPSIKSLQMKAVGHHIQQLRKTSEPLGFIVFVKPWEYDDSNSNFIGFEKFTPIKLMKESGFVIFEGNPKNKVVDSYDHISNKIKAYTAPAFIVLANEAGRKIFDIGVVQDIYHTYYM